MTTLSLKECLVTPTNVSIKSIVTLTLDIMNVNSRAVEATANTLEPFLVTSIIDQGTTQFRGKSEDRVSSAEVVVVVVGNLTIKTTVGGSLIQSITVTGANNNLILKQT